MKIVSLLPSATEIVCLLGLVEKLVGITHECDYPPEVVSKPVMIRPILESHERSSREIDEAIRGELRQGRAVYALDEDSLRRAECDLIITQELCDVCAVSYHDVIATVGRLPGTPQVLALNPRLIFDVIQDIQRVAQATGATERAAPIIAELRRRIDRVVEGKKRAEFLPRVACIEWLEPLYAAGHWIPEMVELAGGRDVLATKGMPSARVSWDSVVAAAPDVLMLMPCGFDIPRTLKELHLVSQRPGWNDLPAVRSGRVWVVNGHAYYSRSGPRLVDGLEFLAHIVHPEWFPRVPPAEAALRLDLFLASKGN